MYPPVLKRLVANATSYFFMMLLYSWVSLITLNSNIFSITIIVYRNIWVGVANFNASFMNKGEINNIQQSESIILLIFSIILALLGDLFPQRRIIIIINWPPSRLGSGNRLKQNSIRLKKANTKRNSFGLTLFNVSVKVELIASFEWK